MKNCINADGLSLEPNGLVGVTCTVVREKKVRAHREKVHTNEVGHGHMEGLKEGMHEVVNERTDE
jgi:hypothetical protein